MKTTTVVLSLVGVAGALAFLHQRGKRMLAATNPSATSLGDVMTAGVRSVVPWAVEPAPTDVTDAVAPTDRLAEAPRRSKPGPRLMEPTWEQLARAGQYT